jgi:hypothetical protein
MYRETGVLELDESAAVAIANTSLDAQQDSGRITNRTIGTSGAVLTVRLEGEMSFTLLRIFLGGGSVSVSATGSAEALPGL